ncbi:uncharacterized protein TNCV_3975041 [Trichonephila clavipes]|nr:uncharacterized protein TNCV_3975041 [Trichonephila clavipes]
MSFSQRGNRSTSNYSMLTLPEKALSVKLYNQNCESVSPASQSYHHKKGVKDLTHIAATRGLLATDLVILNHGQVTWTTPELAPPLLTTTPHQREDVSALDRFNVHCCPTQRVFSVVLGLNS